MDLQFLKKYFLNYKVLAVIYLLSSFIFFIPNLIERSYNNYLIFSSAFSILKNHDNLYALHPEYAWDYFRYTPTFAVLMAPFSFLPDYIGVCLWNALNAMVLFFGVKSVFKDEEQKGSFVLWIIFIELITSIQNSQVNALVAGTMLLAYSGFRDKKIIRTSFFVLLNLFLKIYGFAVAIFFLLYPKKGKFIFSSAIFFIVFFSLPLIFISTGELKQQYQSDFNSMQGLTAALSIMSLVKTWFDLDFNFLWMQVPALLLMMLPVVFLCTHTNEKLKFLFIASLMMFVVSFNQMAESPTYIIGVTGAALWFVNSEKNKLNISLFVLLMLFTCLAPTDLYPKFLRDDFFEPYKIKAFPLFLVWVKVQFEIWEIIVRDPKLFFQTI